MKIENILLTSNVKLKSVFENETFSAEVILRNTFNVVKENYNGLWETICILINYHIHNYIEVNECDVIDVEIDININKSKHFSVRIGLPSFNIAPIETYPPVIDMNEKIVEFLE